MCKIECTHSLSRYESYINFNGKDYCPRCFTKLMDTEMECIKLTQDTMGVKSGTFRHKNDGSVWKIDGAVATGPYNCGYIVSYDVSRI